MSRNRIILIGILAAFFLGLNGFWFFVIARYQAMTVIGGDMLPTLYDGETLYADIHDKSPQRGEVIMFRKEGDNKLIYFGRVVGMPDDVVVWEGRNLSVNGQPLTLTPHQGQDPLLAADSETYEFFDQTLDDHNFTVAHVRVPQMQNDSAGNFKVRPQTIFVMSDNRDNPYDSRTIGLVEIKNVLAKPKRIFMSVIGKKFHFERLFKKIE